MSTTTMMPTISVGFLTSSSPEHTARYGIRNGDYNQFRAHGLFVADLAEKFGSTLYDIGETKMGGELTMYDDDIFYHTAFRENPLDYAEVTMNEFKELPGIKIVVMLYTYMYSDESRKYFYDQLTDGIDGIIYYSSDDEMYYPNYFMNDLENNAEWKSSLTKIKEKLIITLSGHSYCDYSSLGPSMYLPMYPNRGLLESYLLVKLRNHSDRKYDFMVECFTSTQILDRYFKLMPDSKFLVVTNSDLAPYIKSVPDGSDVVVTDGRNTNLADLIELSGKCKYVLVGNTYYRGHNDWYRTHYTQDTMYTAKYLVAYYADRAVIGDVDDSILVKLNEVIPSAPGYFSAASQLYDVHPIDQDLFGPSSLNIDLKVNTIIEYIKHWINENCSNSNPTR